MANHYGLGLLEKLLVHSEIFTAESVRDGNLDGSSEVTTGFLITDSSILYLENLTWWRYY